MPHAYRQVIIFKRLLEYAAFQALFISKEILNNFSKVNGNPDKYFSLHGSAPERAADFRVPVIEPGVIMRMITDVNHYIPHELRHVYADVTKTRELKVGHESPAAVVVHEPYEPLRVAPEIFCRVIFRRKAEKGVRRREELQKRRNADS